MAHQLIVTSAKQGLEGGSGDQAVLRSAGMPPQVASRLKAAGGYSHPFPHGDDRNPVVYVHRIEEAAGKTWHVLGRIRDVGSDHTGRSNFLAHMLAADQADVRGKKAGPAAVMMKAGFKDSWSGPPNGAAPAETLIAPKDEPPQPGSCSAWTAAGLDPGLAGDLAANAAAGKPVVLVTRPDRPHDEVLKLFGDALRLVQPEKRWSVTFNTCAIESFNGIWTAIRADLPQASSLRDSRTAVVIDLTKNPRGSDDPYARFARGDAETLPWQPAAKASPAAATATAELVVDAGPATGPGKPRVTPPGPGGSGIGGRRGVGGDSRPIFIPPTTAEGKRPGWVAPALWIAGSVLFLAGLTGYVFRDPIRDIVWPKPPVDEPKVIVTEDMPAGPTPEEMAREEARKQKEAIGQARQKLAAAGGDRTDGIRAMAEKLQEDIDTFRKGSDAEPGLRIRPDGGGDPRDLADRAIAAANRADEVRRLPDDAPSLLADLEAAATELATAVGLLDAAKQQVPDLAAAERKARKAAMDQKTSNELASRQRDAFAAFAKEASLVRELPARDNAESVLAGKQAKPEADLGPFPVQDLVDPSLSLAVPEETIKGVPFAAEIVPVADDRWEIRSTKGYTGLDGKPQTVAALAVVDGLLRLEVEPKLMDKRPVAILRRCVILAEAKDPQTKQSRVREIRLVKPTKVGALQVAAAAGRQSMQIPVPPGIFSKDTPPGVTTAADLALPVSGIEITGQWGGSEKMTKRLPKEAVAADQPGIVSWPGVRLSEIGNGATLELKVDVSLLGATLTATPTLVGPNAKGIDLEKIAEFFEEHVSSLPDVKKKFESRVKGCEGRKYAKAHGSPGDKARVNAWFRPTNNLQNLAVVQHMKLDFPGHGTVADSMDIFFKKTFAEELARLEEDYQRRLAAANDPKEKEKIKRGNPGGPKDFADWYGRCETASDDAWKSVFEVPLDSWSDWFWKEFEKHWRQQETLARAVHGQDAEVRLLEVVSVARDAQGKEYRVPLVEFDANAPVTKNTSRFGAKGAGAAAEAESNVRSRGTGL
jgi:hypothetical protein